MVAWKARATWVAALVIGAGAIFFVIRFAGRERSPPTRCPATLVDLGPRCCAPGQRLEAGGCVGKPLACPAGSLVGDTGCLVKHQTIPHVGGTLELGPGDWEAEGILRPRTLRVEAFGMDRMEVTTAQWNRCATTERCRAITNREPGLPVTGVTPSEAEAYCRFHGGRLPTGDEWIWAAAGTEGRRYPWGDTGLVCRRAVYGTQAGPCARGATSPELAGVTTDGATTLGVVDLAGNVAEWTAEPDQAYVARGGSFRSRLARELKVWSVERTREPQSHIGFRCVYPSE